MREFEQRLPPMVARLTFYPEQIKSMEPRWQEWFIRDTFKDFERRCRAELAAVGIPETLPQKRGAK